MIAVGTIGERKVKLFRPELRFLCRCGQGDNIVLPRARGVLQFQCPFCNRQWKIVFGKEGGSVYEVV